MKNKKSTFFRKNKGFSLSGLRSPTLIIGLPGVGNVGKIVTDYAVENLCADEVGRFYVDMPPMVFPSAFGVVFPSIKLYYKRLGRGDFLFVTGDYQPRDNKCFEFCAELIKFFKQVGGKEMVVLAGAAFPQENKKPKIFCVSNKPKLFKKYKGLYSGITPAYGTLGPIVGVAGVLLGLAREEGIDATSFLIETSDEFVSPQSVRTAVLLLNKLIPSKLDSRAIETSIGEMQEEAEEFKKFLREEERLLGEVEKSEKGKKEDKKKNFGYIG